MLRFLDHCKKIGAFENLLIVIEPFPETRIEDGLLETNGAQYYKNWDKMVSYNSKGKASLNKTIKDSFSFR